MGVRKKKYRRRRREIIGKQSAASRKLEIMISYNGQQINLFDKYIEFLRNLETKANFKNKAQSINIKSKEWNDMRRCRITASHVKRIYKWRRNSSYIYEKITRKIEKYFKTRGDKIERLILKILKNSGYEVRYSGKLWIHRDLPWISGTTDGVLIKDGKINTVLEVKSYESDKSFKKAFEMISGKYILRKSSHEYYQIQLLAEIINVTHIYFVFEYKYQIFTQVIERDLDFLYRIFDTLKRFYFKNLIPYLILDPKLENNSQKQKKIEYMSDVTYNRLMKILLKNEYMINGNTEESILSYYGDELPSEVNDGFFDLFTNKELLKKMLTEELIQTKISEEDLRNI